MLLEASLFYLYPNKVMKYSLLFLFAILFITSCTNNTKEHPETKPPATAVTACTLSEISYCSQPQDSLSKYLPGWTIVWNPASVNGNYAFVATDGYNYAIAIRGSVMDFNRDALNNWIYQDLHVAVQKKWPYTDSVSGAKISEGTYDGWENLTAMKDIKTGQSLERFLDSTTTTATPILITGHSLGGNLATVYASWLYTHFETASKLNEHINVITFAAPAAGNKNFAQDFDKKFPQSVRFENANDIVPKFPVADKIETLGKLYDSIPAAAKIEVGYNSATIPLSSVFDFISIAVKGIELVNGFSTYTQTNGNGRVINIPLSGKNNSHDISSWFAEAGYHHSIEQYAAFIGAPVIKTP